MTGPQSQLPPRHRRRPISRPSLLAVLLLVLLAPSVSGVGSAADEGRGDGAPRELFVDRVDVNVVDVTVHVLDGEGTSPSTPSTPAAPGRTST